MKLLRSKLKTATNDITNEFYKDAFPVISASWLIISIIYISETIVFQNKFVIQLTENSLNTNSITLENHLGGSFFKLLRLFYKHKVVL